MSDSNKWKMRKALTFGAIFGGLYGLVTSVFSVGFASSNQIAESIGMIVGAAVAGMVLFGLAAFVRNLIVK